MNNASINESPQSIDEDTIRFFVWSVWNFFKTSTGIEPEIGAPYLFSKFEHNDYTGIIGVSGSQKGAVYFTMSQKILDGVLSINYPSIKSQQVSSEELEDMRSDYAGEMTNIVSGNVRNYLGEQFLISVPVVVTAPNSEIRLSNGVHGIVFPVQWSNNQCHLILCLENNQVSDNQSSEMK